MPGGRFSRALLPGRITVRRRARRPQETMARQDANEQFLATSFLDGANAAYIEQLYARYEADPASVGEEWQAFFKALEDQPSDVIKAAKGASWKRANWPIAAP